MGNNRKFFADLGLKQILSGYYDGAEIGDAIHQRRDNTKFIPGISGVMFPKWKSKYTSLFP